MTNKFKKIALAGLTSLVMIGCENETKECVEKNPVEGKLDTLYYNNGNIKEVMYKNIDCLNRKVYSLYFNESGKRSFYIEYFYDEEGKIEDIQKLNWYPDGTITKELDLGADNIPDQRWIYNPFIDKTKADWNLQNNEFELEEDGEHI